MLPRRSTSSSVRSITVTQSACSPDSANSVSPLKSTRNWWSSPLSSRSTAPCRSSARSSEVSVCASAITSSAPASRSAALCSAATSSTSRKVTEPGLDLTAVPSVVSPNMPTWNGPTSTRIDSCAPSMISPSLSMLLAPSIGKLASAMRSMATAGPKSYSWLPIAMAVRSSWLSSSIMCAPWSKPDISDGEMASPAKVTITLSCMARSALITAASRATPPWPPLSSMRSRSLKCTMVSSTGAANRWPAARSRAVSAAAATARGLFATVVFTW